MSRISIAMTTYNGEKFVEKQLLSLLNQTRKADEVIIHDDKSTDKTGEIVREFIQKYELKNWKFKTNEQNVGFIRNFYGAIKETTGDVIFLCDQDDIWLENKVEIMGRIFETNPEVQALNSSFRLVDGEAKPIHTRKKHGMVNCNLIRLKCKAGALVKIPLPIVIRQNISPGCTMAFSSELRQKYLMESENILPHDMELNYLAALQDGLYYYDLPTINYRIHCANTLGLKPSITGRLNVAEEKLKSAAVIDKFCEHNPYKSHIQEFLQFCINRKNALENRSLRQILDLYRYRKIYCNCFTVKERLGDLAFSLLKSMK